MNETTTAFLFLSYLCVSFYIFTFYLNLSNELITCKFLLWCCLYNTFNESSFLNVFYICIVLYWLRSVICLVFFIIYLMLVILKFYFIG